MAADKTNLSADNLYERKIMLRRRCIELLHRGALMAMAIGGITFCFVCLRFSIVKEYRIHSP